MADQANNEDQPLPPLPELKAIGYDLITEIGALSTLLRNAQKKLATVRLDIARHPDNLKEGEANG